MTLQDIKTRKESGFTIVELLIVIVIIAILAAITIIAYNGIQNRSKTASAQSAANNFQKKAEAYNADSTASTYPSVSADLTSASSGTTYYLNGVSVDATALASPGNLPSDPSEVNFYRCGTNTSAAATSLATTTVVTGGQVRYWNYSTNNTVTVPFGQTSGTSPGGYNVTCYIAS